MEYQQGIKNIFIEEWNLGGKGDLHSFTTPSTIYFFFLSGRPPQMGTIPVVNSDEQLLF